VRTVFGILFSILLLFSTLHVHAYAKDEKITWTEEELKFMEDHPVIELGVDPQFVPLMAKLIEENLDRKSDFVARYGGEEFAILLSNTTEDAATRLAEKIRKIIEEAEIDNGIEKTSITVSLGVASMISTRLMSASDLIKTADRALYEAKEKGRNQVVKASSIKVYELVARR